MPLAILLPTGRSLRKKGRIHATIKFRNVQGIYIQRRVRYPFSLRELALLLDGKSFFEATRWNLVNVVSSIESEDHAMKRRTEECITCFYRGLKEGGDGDEYPEEVRWIKSKCSLNHRIAR